MADITPYNLTATPSIASSGDEIIFTWKWDPTPQHNVESLTGSRGYLFQQLDSSGNVIRSVRTAASLTNPQTKLAFPGYPYDPYYLEYRVYATEWQWDSANAGNEPLLGGPSNVVRVYDSRKPETPGAPAYITIGEAVQGETVDVSWGSVSNASYVLERSVNGGTFASVYTGSSISYTDTADSTWSTVQYRVKAVVSGASSDWTVSAVKTVQAPEQPEPTTPTAGRLEQFQNRAGTNIYPRTVMEGVFRQSDGKSLEELLVILEEDKEQGIPAGGSAGQVLTKQSSADYDTQWKTLVTYSTGDLTAGSSSLASGQIYLVYE